MSETLKMLKDIEKYLNSTRLAGHTTAMINGIRGTQECIVLSVSADHAIYLDRKLKDEGVDGRAKLVTLYNTDKLAGERLPLLVDNGTLGVLVSGAIRAIEKEQEHKLHSAPRVRSGSINDSDGAEIRTIGEQLRTQDSRIKED